MKIEDILANPENYLNQIIELEAYLAIVKENEHFIAYLTSTPDIADAEKQQISIAHSLAELKTIIHPLPSLQLLYRGELTNPPYYYYFPVDLRAKFILNESNQTVLQEIHGVHLIAPYAGKLSEVIGRDSYEYSAEISYQAQVEPESQAPARAKVSAERYLQFKENLDEAMVLGENDKRYARLLLNQTIKLSGWLHYLPAAKAAEHYFVLKTFAIRPSMVSLGNNKDFTDIWIRPSQVYKALRAHILIKQDNDVHQYIGIQGKIDYYQDDAPILESQTQPKLYFTEIQAISIYEESYLLDIEP